MQIEIKKLNPAASLPEYKTEGAAAFDLYAVESMVIKPGEIGEFFTGISMAIPSGFMGLIAPRSGIGKKGLVLANIVGKIDSDYRGEIICNMLNRTDDIIFHVAAGDRIAQMSIVPVISAEFVEVDALPDTERGAGGFGSTGE